MSGRIQILQIEASREAADRIESALGEAGFAADCLRVRTRLTLDEAVKARAFDIALAATAVPRLTAPVALRLIHATRPGLPVIALTPSRGSPSSASLLRSGAADVVAADDHVRLVGAVHRILRTDPASGRSRSAAAYRMLFDCVGDLVLVTDFSGNILDANDVAVGRLGYERGRLFRMTLRDLDPAALGENLTAAVERAEREGLVISESRWFAAGGVPVPVAVTLKIIEDRGRPRLMHLARDLSGHKQAERALLEREDDLRRLSARLIQVREEERNRIARNIHDDLGHAVMTIKMNLFLADMTLAAGRNPVREIVKNMKDQVDTLLETIQRISMEVRPAVLYDLGLVDALQFYVKRFEEQTKIACRMRTAGGIPDLPEETAITVYRIVQEVFVNMFRHSGCAAITLDLAAAEGRFRLAIADNGKGIAREKIGSLDSLGIIGMRERALSLGGDFAIAGEPGKGTVVTLSFPLPESGARG
jgi:two-component system sensor histidine kinase UhpB